jgi:hypothetical protein
MKKVLYKNGNNSLFNYWIKEVISAEYPKITISKEPIAIGNFELLLIQVNASDENKINYIFCNKEDIETISDSYLLVF